MAMNLTTTWRGWKAKYNGKTLEEHGGLWHGLTLLEGPRKGEVVYTHKKPGEED
jgi:hypothetical protein